MNYFRLTCHAYMSFRYWLPPKNTFITLPWHFMARAGGKWWQSCHSHWFSGMKKAHIFFLLDFFRHKSHWAYWLRGKAVRGDSRVAACRTLFTSKRITFLVTTILHSNATPPLVVGWEISGMKCMVRPRTCRSLPYHQAGF